MAFNHELKISVKTFRSLVLDSELKTLEWDIPNPVYLTWVSKEHTFDFLHKLIDFLDIVEKNQKPVF